MEEGPKPGNGVLVARPRPARPAVEYRDSLNDSGPETSTTPERICGSCYS